MPSSSTPPKPRFERRRCRVLQERRVVGSRARARRCAGRRACAPRRAPRPCPCAIARACRRFQTVTPVSGSLMSCATPLTNRSSVCEPPALEEAAAVAVAVDVDDGLLSQLRVVLLDPLGRAEQPRLFAVPRRVDDRALRPPALLQQLAERARLLELRRHAADRIAGAVHPRVVMVAADDPFVGIGRARDPAR